jgi:hypothetical protein
MRSLFTKFKFKKVPINRVLLRDIIQVNEFANIRNGNLYRLDNYISINNQSREGDYYIGSELDHNLVTVNNGDKYEFDVGDADMVVGKDKLGNLIFAKRDTYDVLQYPYKIKTVSYSQLRLGDVVRSTDTGQLYKIVDFNFSNGQCKCQKLDIELGKISEELVRFWAGSGCVDNVFDYRRKECIRIKEDRETIKILDDTCRQEPYFEVLDL